MEVGIKDAKNNLSSLVLQARAGTRVFLTNRGQKVAELVPVQEEEAPEVANRGLGWLKGKAKFPKDYQKWKEKSSRAVMKDMGIL